ncbi:hypothetical protein ACP70R_004143 [Stipagrostis hirtigluma subsp. patula]
MMNPIRRVRRRCLDASSRQDAERYTSICLLPVLVNLNRM